MNVKKEITMNWNEAPDTITPEIYSQIRGHSVQWARDRFNERNFPKLESGKQIADKTAVMLYDLGINNNSKLINSNNNIYYRTYSNKNRKHNSSSNTPYI